MLELYSVASGSSGNCICVGTDSTHVLIDAGISGKRVEDGLNLIDLTCRDMEGILITHEHIDHIAGIGVLARRYGIPLYGTKGTLEAVAGSSRTGSIDPGLFCEITPEEDFAIGDMTFHPISVPHDAADPVAYRFTNGSRRMAVITDLGTYDERIQTQLTDLDALLLEANHDIRMLETGAYPYQLKQRILGDRGHLSNERCGELLSLLLNDSFGAVLLGHLSKENNYPELAYETVRLEITMGDTPYTADDFPIQVANRDAPTPVIRVS